MQYARSIFVHREKPGTLSQLQRWQRVSMHVYVYTKGKCIGSHVDTFKKYSWQVKLFMRGAVLRVFQEHTSTQAAKDPNTISNTTYRKIPLFFHSVYAFLQADVDKCVKCLGPSHEWSNRLISCMMAVRSHPDGLCLSDLQFLHVCLWSQQGLTVQWTRLWGFVCEASSEIHLGFFAMNMSVFLFLRFLYIIHDLPNLSSCKLCSILQVQSCWDYFFISMVRKHV